MKTRSALLSIPIIVFLFWPAQEANAQIWEKIKKKTQKKVENVVTEKISDKAAEIAAKNLEKMLSANINPFGKGVKKGDPSKLPERYLFEWKYEMKMQMKIDGEPKNLVFDYYLAPGKSYLGYSLPKMESMFTVIDNKLKMMISYIEQDGQAMAVVYSLPEKNEQSAPKKATPNYTITELPNKEFLGYESEGLQLENAESRIILYMAADAPVSLTDAFTSKKSKVPDALKEYISENNSGLIMYMKYIDKQNPENSMTMECISLEEALLIKSNSNYKFL